MAGINIKIATRKYNDIMEWLGYEHNTIGTRLSENTDGWNLRDMVAECDYTLSTYYECGHCNEEMRYDDDPYVRAEWKKHTSALRSFIKTYSPYINDIECASGHCSKFD